MKYMGSKNRIAKHILPLILNKRQPNQVYVEPFCGGANLVDKVSGTRLANDKCPYLIALLKKLQEPSVFYCVPIDETLYNHINKHRVEYEDWIVGFSGYCLSFAGKFFGGYARDKKGGRNYQEEATRNLIKQQASLVGVIFNCGGYTDLVLPHQSLVYCDPPYQNTTGYQQGSFNGPAFYDWCFAMKQQGHTLFISEQQMPMGFECVWEGSIYNSVSKKGRVTSPERLYALT